jgi:hypothetical protein
MSALKSKCWLFAGPTLNGAGALTNAAGVKVLSPVKRGDVERLVATRRRGVIAIVDGQFHQCLSVGHLEIRLAIDSGWQVWGLSSMGAIRACEMRHLGMRGYGKVYDWFCRDENFRDDEVALVHLPEPPYLPVTEPLIHIRLWLQELVRTDLISSRQKRNLLKRLMAIWFGERTLSNVRAMLANEVSDLRSTSSRQRRAGIEKSLENFDRFRVKSLDLAAFLKEKPWQVSTDYADYADSIQRQEIKSV